ncbi:MAG: type II/IV secretion system protein [Deltaproteobacteria bacterium]|nr:type II/IV secretion system protein [Deltaproteobacteria bacterium]MBW1935421.1 type II/IV secretion system protein [Deltaproteobacteria bacterium]MBW1978658.1 type II/IV secretion system protein [Deltaproteobacteria bacterium]MBW2045100.1 type II/IV secretion system protein [Deltaproteobacteria bacterium]MBW2299247.1 type II/IV secretion system protein [Deltaproteobacteria bacterium]
MAKSSDKLSAENVCKVLLKYRLISEAQRREIMAKKDRLAAKMEQIRAMRQASSKGRIFNPVTIVDVIASLQMERADDPSKPLDEETIFQCLAKAWKIPYKKIDPLKLDLNLVTTTIPHTFAMKHLVLPVGRDDESLTVATPDPFNVEVMQDIAQVTHLKVKPVVSTKTDIIKLINEFFGFKRSIVAAEHQFSMPSVDLGNLEQFVRLRASDELPSNDQHIVNAVDHLFSYAFDQRASDVHIEPKREKSVVRLRIDGTLHTVYELPKNVHSAIVTRIKNLARLDMAEKRRPQDGRIKMEKGGVEAEIRVSSVPVAFGEKLVMRIMDPDILFQELENLGFTSMDLIRYHQFINMPHGIVLVCGPTGSGKSTTLYSTLRYLSSPDINITTIEDPIEMVDERFNQIAVQPAIGITFASILRNILRQDPDIIMIGEMRDLETAENAIQAALTGHLVLSTLHTNDAPSSITRLLDLGIPSFLIQATVAGIVAQRLVRKICPHCKESFEIESAELSSMGLDVGGNGYVSLHRGKGCLKCRGTGYLGRSGIFEVLPVTEGIRKLITPECDVEILRDVGRREGMVTLRENAIKKLLDGKTTYQEVLRVTWEQL